MKSTIKGALAAFSISALGAFALMSTSPASAAVLTVWQRDCFVSGSGTVCPIQGGTATQKVSMVYYDFVSTGVNKTIIGEYYRLTYDGTMRSSSTSGVYSAGFHELSNNVTDLNVNASVWDYISVDVIGDAGSGMNVLTNIYGMALVTP